MLSDILPTLLLHSGPLAMGDRVRVNLYLQGTFEVSMLDLFLKKVLEFSRHPFYSSFTKQSLHIYHVWVRVMATTVRDDIFQLPLNLGEASSLGFSY